MEFNLEVVTLPVRDVDAAKAFYTALGFQLDVDYHPREGFRVVQLTPPGSACSIQFGDRLTDAAPGSARVNYLVVADIEAAHAELVARDIKVGDIRHKSPVGTWAGGGVAGTPTFFINNDRHDGPQDVPILTRVIQQSLATAT